MCGIAGYVDFSSKTNPSIVGKMTDCIAYRGPDSIGKFVNKDNTVGLGIRRLSIIDLTTGDQPVTNEDGSVIVVYNGEIFNYKELRKELIQNGHRFKTLSDTEILVHGYEQWGDVFIRKLNGMFAFSLWDENNKRLLLGRDRVGIKPLYYYTASNLLFFGSEPKTILTHPAYKKEIDSQALDDFWYLGFFAGETSIYKGIRKLLPGYMLSFDKTGLATTRYFDLINDTKTTYENLDNLLRAAVEKQLVSDVPVGVFLSGGLDSSLIAYYASKTKRLKSFSIGFSEPGFDESEEAEYVAKTIGTKHISEEFVSKDVISIYEKVITKLDEPLADASLIPTYKVSKLAREHVTVALSGDGGDELFGGYPTHQAHLYAKLLNLVPTKGLLSIIKNTPERLINLIPTSFKDYSKKELASILVEGLTLQSSTERHLFWMRTFFLGKSTLGKYKAKNIGFTSDLQNVATHRIGQIVDFNTYLRDDFLVKTDRASMFNSLEVRVPFLDNAVLNYAFSTDDPHLTLVKTKIHLRRLIKDKLPQIAKRPKKGFGLPLKIWLKNDLKDFALSMLSNKKLYNYIEKKKVNDLWLDYYNHNANNTGVIWQLIVFSGWLDNWA